MFDRLLRRTRPETDIATRVYGAIVAQARKPAFYAGFGVPDTVTGRFEMVVAHVALVVDRLQRDAAESAIGQRIFDLYCFDMDRSLRELGFGDLGVPHRMKKMTEAFYGRARAYREAIIAGDRAALSAAVERNILAPGAAGAGPLADYLAESAAVLASMATPALLEAPRFAAGLAGADADWPGAGHSP